MLCFHAAAQPCMHWKLALRNTATCSSFATARAFVTRQLSISYPVMLARTLQNASDICCRLLTSQSRAAGPFLQQRLQAFESSSSVRTHKSAASDDSTEK